MNTLGLWSMAGVGVLVGIGGCLEPQFASDAGAVTRLSQDVACMQYCEAVMPCDGLAASAFRDTADCQQTCLQIAEQWETVGDECDFAHREFLVCMSEMTCDESDDFLTYGPGDHPICGNAEQRVLDCQ